MRRDITRRDFLNGVAMTAGAVMPWDLFAMGGQAESGKEISGLLSAGAYRTSRQPSRII
jgi:hypothetical protein